jgi:hypothetical protein
MPLEAMPLEAMPLEVMPLEVTPLEMMPLAVTPWAGWYHGQQGVRRVHLPLFSGTSGSGYGITIVDPGT